MWDTQPYWSALKGKVIKIFCCMKRELCIGKPETKLFLCYSYWTRKMQTDKCLMVQGIMWLMACQLTVGSQEGMKKWRGWKEISCGGDQWLNLSDCWEMWHFLCEGKQVLAKCALLGVAWPIRTCNSGPRALLAGTLQHCYRGRKMH